MAQKNGVFRTGWMIPLRIRTTQRRRRSRSRSPARTSERRVGDRAACCLQKRAVFFERFHHLCLSRACLGTMILFDLKSGPAPKRKTVSLTLTSPAIRLRIDRSEGFRFLQPRRILLLLRLGHPAENGFFEPFIYKDDHFAKTGSGQT